MASACSRCVLGVPVPPQKVKRRKYYQTGGPDYIWAMDKNEKVGMFGFKILCAVDGFSRYPIHWEVRLAPLLLSPYPYPLPPLYPPSRPSSSSIAFPPGRYQPERVNALPLLCQCTRRSWWGSCTRVSRRRGCVAGSRCADSSHSRRPEQDHEPRRGS